MSLPAPDPLPSSAAVPHDAGLVSSVIDKDRWFTNEIHVHGPALRSYLQRAFPLVRDEVDDVVQESYLRIWKARAGQPLASAKAFLFKVARHVTLDFLRHQQKSPVEAVEDLSVLPVVEERRGVAEAASMEEKIRLLAAGLAALSPRGREIVVLHRFQGLSQRETAERLGISEKTVGEHYQRAMKRLGAHLREQGVSSHYDR